MTKGPATINGAYEEGAEECGFCSKSKEGVVVEMDGAEMNLCWTCLKKLVKLKASSKPKAEPATPLFDGNGTRTATLMS